MYTARIENDKFVIYNMATKDIVIIVESESEMYDYVQRLNNRGISEFKQYLQNKQSIV